MRIGAHVSAAGGLANAVATARRLQCETFQVFVSNPRGWALPPFDPGGDERFRELAAAAGLRPVFIHAPYLVNFASTSDQFRERSRALVAATLARGAAMGAAGVVVHANDSAEPAGACRDHHARVGTGAIGLTGFLAILAHPGLARLPVVIETPGSDQERAADIARLK